MSKDIEAEGNSAEEPKSGTDSAALEADPERELEALADRIAEVIHASPAADREALHDYAVSLVRERLPVAAELSYSADSAVPVIGRSATTGSAGGVQSLGYGVLLVPIGFFLFWIFPFIGVMLGFAGVAMIVWGLVVAVVSRFRASAIGNHENT